MCFTDFRLSNLFVLTRFVLLLRSTNSRVTSSIPFPGPAVSASLLMVVLEN